MLATSSRLEGHSSETALSHYQRKHSSGVTPLYELPETLWFCLRVSTDSFRGMYFLWKWHHALRPNDCIYMFFPTTFWEMAENKRQGWGIPHGGLSTLYIPVYSWLIYEWECNISECGATTWVCFKYTIPFQSQTRRGGGIIWHFCSRRQLWSALIGWCLWCHELTSHSPKAILQLFFKSFHF